MALSFPSSGSTLYQFLYQFLYIAFTSSPREAKEKDWGVIVMNTNLNDIDGESIEGSEEPEVHGETVWKTMIAPAKASKVVVVAHSYGGIVAMHLASTFGEEWVS